MSYNDVPPLVVLDPRLSKRRVVVMDLGHSTIPRVRRSVQLERLTWENVEEVQEETQAGMMLLCGAPLGHFPVPTYIQIEKM